MKFDDYFPPWILGRKYYGVRLAGGVYWFQSLNEIRIALREVIRHEENWDQVMQLVAHDLTSDEVCTLECIRTQGSR